MSNQGKSLTEISYNMKKLLSINDNVFDYYLEKTYSINLSANLSKYDPAQPLLTVKNPHNDDLALLSIQFDLEQNIKDNGNFIITNDGVTFYEVAAGGLKYADTVYIDLKKGLKFKANKELKLYAWTKTGSTQNPINVIIRIGDYCK